MTTLTWIYVSAGLVMGALSLIHFKTTRRWRHTLTRRSLSSRISELLIWTPFGVIFALDSDWVISVMLFATFAAIFLPDIIWILKLPKDDHVA